MQVYSSSRNLTAGVIAMLLVASSLAGCATRPTFSDAATAPDEEAIPMHLGRVQTQTQDDVTVQLVIPTDEQVAGHFGVPLAQFGIQPIWIRIDNASSASYWILPISIDPDYFTADEAALLATEKMNAADDARVTEIFRQSALPFFLQAGSVHEGYVYATHQRGGRFVDVRASAHGHPLIRMRFAVMLPTEGFDYESSTLRQLYALVDKFPDLTIEQARVRIRELPCCTTTGGRRGRRRPDQSRARGQRRGRDFRADGRRLDFHGGDHGRQRAPDDRCGDRRRGIRERAGECPVPVRPQAGPGTAAGPLEDRPAQSHAALARSVPLRRAAGLGRPGQPGHRREGNVEVPDAHDAHHRPERGRVPRIRAAEPVAPRGRAVVRLRARRRRGVSRPAPAQPDRRPVLHRRHCAW